MYRNRVPGTLTRLMTARIDALAPFPPTRAVSHCPPRSPLASHLHMYVCMCVCMNVCMCMYVCMDRIARLLASHSAAALDDGTYIHRHAGTIMRMHICMHVSLLASRSAAAGGTLPCICMHACSYSHSNPNLGRSLSGRNTTRPCACLPACMHACLACMHSCMPVCMASHSAAASARGTTTDAQRGLPSPAPPPHRVLAGWS